VFVFECDLFPLDDPVTMPSTNSESLTEGKPAFSS